MSESWHYAWQGKSEGPVGTEVIADLIRAGRVRADTLVWREGLANWEPANSHFAFGTNAQTVAPPPPMPAYAATAPAAPGQAAPPRSFAEAIKVCFQKYATFRGRASRSEYWWFQLFIILLSILGSVLEFGMGRDGQALSAIFGIATFLPNLSVSVRRLHDTDRSGWWIGGFYLALIPAVVVLGLAAALSDAAMPGAGGALMGGIFGLGVLAYVIAMIVFMASRGTPGPNRFG